MISAAAAQGVSFCNPLSSGKCLAGWLTGVEPASAVASAGLHTAVGSATADAVAQLAQAIGAGVGQVLTGLLTLWIHLPSPDLASDPVPREMQQYLWPWTVGVALLGFIVVSARLVLTRKGAALADLGQALLTMSCVTAAGLIVPTLLMRAGDAWSTWVLQESTSGNVPGYFKDMFGVAAAYGLANGTVIIVGIVFLLVTVVQAILLLFRLGSVVILAGTLPLAAAGSAMPLTKGWFRKVATWMLALIFWKPAAAMVLATGFLMMRTIGRGNTVINLFTGLAVFILSIVAMPAMMKFFTWAPGELAGSGGGMLGSMIGAASAIGAMSSSGGGSAAGQADAISNGLGPSGGAAGGGPDGSAGVSPGGSPGGSDDGRSSSGEGRSSPGGGPSASVQSGPDASGGQPGAQAGASQGAGGSVQQGVAAAGGGTITLGAQAAARTGQAVKDGAEQFAQSSGPPQDQNQGAA